jgi:tetratricopeptide (TPR) repeat protein
VLEIGNWLMAELEIREGRAEDACARLEPLKDTEGPYLIALLANLAWAQLNIGDPVLAGETVGRALQLADLQHQRLWLPHLLHVQGMILTRQERWDEADRAFEEAISMARSMPYPYVEGLVLHTKGLMFNQQGLDAQAQCALDKALGIFRRLGAHKDIELTESALSGVSRPAESAR